MTWASAVNSLRFSTARAKWPSSPCRRQTVTTRPVRDTGYDGKRITCRDLHGAMQAQSVVLAYPADDDQQPALAQAFAQAVHASFSRQAASQEVKPARAVHKDQAMTDSPMAKSATPV